MAPCEEPLKDLGTTEAVRTRGRGGNCERLDSGARKAAGGRAGVARDCETDLQAPAGSEFSTTQSTPASPQHASAMCWSWRW